MDKLDDMAFLLSHKSKGEVNTPASGAVLARGNGNSETKVMNMIFASDTSGTHKQCSKPL